jgi:uncharacterized protein
VNKTKKDGGLIMTLVILVCLAMAYVEIVVAPGYAIKSGIKIGLFLGAPLLFLITSKKISFQSLFPMKKGGWRFSVILAAVTFFGILGIYLIFGRWFDFSAVVPSLQGRLGIDGKNFIFIALYISFINSLLEEFFFRGFAFLSLLKTSGRKLAYGFSAMSFALYHVSIMNGWFSPLLMGLLIISLLLAGLLFNYIDEKEGSILPSWMVHISANFAINLIGFMILGVIPGL